MGKRFIRAAAITCMLFLVMKIGSSPSPQYSVGSTLQIMPNDSETMFPALTAVFQ